MVLISRQLLGHLIASTAIAALTYGDSSSGRPLSRLAAGAGLLVVAAVLTALSLAAVLMAFFFALADWTNLLRPTLITTAIGMLLSILAGLEGWRLLRRPFRRQ